MTSVSEKFKELQAKKEKKAQKAEKTRKQSAHQVYMGKVSGMIEEILDGFDDKIKKAFNEASKKSVLYEPTLRSEVNLGFWSSHSEDSDVEKFAKLPAFKKLQKECAARGVAYEFNKERARDEVDELSMYLKLTIHLSKTQAEAEARSEFGRFFKFC